MLTEYEVRSTYSILGTYIVPMGSSTAKAGAFGVNQLFAVVAPSRGSSGREDRG